MNLLLRLTVAAFLSTAGTSGLTSGRPCLINLENWKYPNPPLIAQEGKFLYPEVVDDEEHRIVTVEDGDSVDFFCHGPGVELARRGGVSSMHLTCQDAKLMVSSETSVRVQYLTCDGPFEPVVKRTPGVSCAEEDANGIQLSQNLALVEIGWELPSGQFVNQIELCIDEDSYATLWTRHVVSGSAIKQQDVNDRPNFRRDNHDETGYDELFPNFDSQGDIANSYTKSQEALQMETLYGTSLAPDGTLFINESSSSNVYLARGHLSPDAAFIYGPQQDATYFYSNVAPQYQTFNGGNWKALEGAVRDYAAEQGTDIEVYTGTYGHLSYPDERGASVPYHSFTKEGKKWIPAPAFYWKVVHNSHTGEAIAFVGQNDAHALSPPELFCEDQCGQLSWVDWDLSDLESGFMYCCRVEELRQTIANVPDLSSTTDDGAWPDLMTDAVEEESIPEGSCLFDVDAADASIPPLLLVDGEFVFPTHIDDATAHRLVIIPNGSTLQLVCHGSERKPSVMVDGCGDSSSATVECADGAFLGNEQPGVCTCSEKHTPHIRINSDAPPCAPESANGRSVNPDDLISADVGWLVDGQFHPQITVCLDTKYYASLWTHHVVHGSAIALRDKTPSRPSFKRDLPGMNRFFPRFSSNSKLNSVFSVKSQREDAILILGENIDQATGNQLFTTKESRYLARGHLSPDAAFPPDAFQDATYFFFNVAPQFQCFNNGNWKALEGAVRDYAAGTSADVDVYTGTYGQLKFKNTAGSRRTFYMSDEGGQKSFYPPSIFWKVIHNSAKGTAIAFVGVNNCALEEPPKLLCPNRCDTLSWADWAMEDLTKGYMYCCDVEKLRETVEYVPDLSDENGNWPSLMTDNAEAA